MSRNFNENTRVQSKRTMTEEEVKLRLITPAIERVGWNKMTQINMECAFTDGRIVVRDQSAHRDKQSKKKADYLLSYKPNLPLAIVEAKDDAHGVGDGMQQAIGYAEMLDVPFVYSSNGLGFLEHDMKRGTERELRMDEFPSPEELWQRYSGEEQFTQEQEKLVTSSYYFQQDGSKPRYYQRIAINRVIEAVARGQKRILLVMATGTGKTYTAFQIIYRLRESGSKKKILYLVDRNYLVDQPMHKDFKPFAKIMTKVEGKKLDSSYELYMSLYQQLAGDENEEPFRAFQPDFFDLIIVDECHRGSAPEDSCWRKILEYFHSATQIGMTATPKETTEVSNITYFGEPVYTYSLKQGIDDGFLAPYKVVRVNIDKDVEGYRPSPGQQDIFGNEIEDREYDIKDFDRTLIIDERTQLVAKRITRYLKETDRFAKTIVFCVDINHAERMRQALVNENSDLVAQNSKYVMRITGDEKEGKDQLDNFTAADSKYPTIVTTSKLLTTGVDCETCKLIVIDNNIGSMTEFKQIIGRGTRLKESYGKMFFTIMDFRNACRLFADPNFDGDPVVIIEDPTDDGGDDDPIVHDPEGVYDPDGGSEVVATPPEDPSQAPKKYQVRGVNVEILNERVEYYDGDGKRVTESLTDYSKKNILGEYATLDSFLKVWNSDEKKQAILDELQGRGVLLESLREMSGNKDLDDFDLICHIAYDKAPLTKAERANNVRKRGYLYKYSGVAQQVIGALLDKYMDEGIGEIEDPKILSIDPFRRFGAPTKIADLFGGREGYIQAVRDLQKEIYAA